MPGAIFQLKLRSTQDTYLTGKPEVNFIKQVYKRHVNFASEQILTQATGEIDFGRKFTIKIPSVGDFLHRMFFTFRLPALQFTSGTFAGWTNSIGHAIVDYVDLVIGDQLIDRHYGLFMEIWDELTIKPGIRSAEHRLIGKFGHVELLRTNALEETVYHVPMQFWFCKNIGSSLPLIALWFHEVKLIFNLRPFSDCVVYDGATEPTPVSIVSGGILAEHIFLDTEERLLYKKKDYKFLIDQVQDVQNEPVPSWGSHLISLPFNHPVYEMIFVIREFESEINNDWFNFSIRNAVVNTPVYPMLKSAKLILDNHDRTYTLEESVLSLVNSQMYHTHVTDKDIYTMPFCMYPEKIEPSGSLNFSTLSSAILLLNLENSIPASKCHIFAKNFNIFRIQNGISGILFNS